MRRGIGGKISEKYIIIDSRRVLQLGLQAVVGFLDDGIIGEVLIEQESVDRAS